MAYGTFDITATGTTGYAVTKSRSETTATVTINGTAYAGVSFTFQASIDGTNFFNVLAVDNSSGATVTGGTSISPTDDSESSWTIPNVVNFVSIRTNVSAYTSGTASIVVITGVALSQPMVVVNTTAGAFTTGTFSSTLAVTGALSGANSIKSSNATAGIGYATGAGGTVTQATSRATGVTLNTVCGNIVLVSAAGSSTPFSFTLTNSAIAAGDDVIVNQKSGTDKYTTQVVTAVGAGSCQITLANASGTTTEQPVFNFAVIKAVAA